MSKLETLTDERLIEVLRESIEPIDDPEPRGRFCDLIESEFSRRGMIGTFYKVLREAEMLTGQVETIGKTKAKLREAHGDPQTFYAACYKAFCDGYITYDELITGTDKYKAEYAAAPDT